MSRLATRGVAMTLPAMLVLGACGGPSLRGSSGPSPAGVPRPASSSQGSAPASGTPRASPAESRSGSPLPKPGPSGLQEGSQIPLDIDVPSCVERTRPAQGTIRTVPAAIVGASAAYADDESHNNYWIGSAGPDGEFPLVWTPPPDAPLGAARILAGATSDQGGATAIAHFRLAAPGGC